MCLADWVPMKFGKDFSIHLEETLPDWRDKFLCYKYLKKLLKNYPDQLNDTIDQNHAHEILHRWFVIILRAELKKFNDFYTDKEEDFIIRFQVCCLFFFFFNFSFSLCICCTKLLNNFGFLILCLCILISWVVFCGCWWIWFYSMC